jgi:hypothetical protein
MKTITTDYAEELIDFAPTHETRQMGFAEAQLHGAVAGFNMLAKNRLAYLADEVGMGKTYVALAIMGMLRFQQPKARIVVITPRENIQMKWIKELTNFTRCNWRQSDNCFKNLRNQPVHPPLACSRIDEMARAWRIHAHHDFFLRMSSFSLAVNKAEGRRRCRKMLRPYTQWIPKQFLGVKNPSDFRDQYGRAINALVPPIDLLVIDEAHNFKHGFHKQVSNRNRILGMALGHPDGQAEDCPWYGHRVKRLLLISATPFEYDYADIYRQLEVFGFAGIKLLSAEGKDPVPVRGLLDGDEEGKRKIVRRFLLRRVSYLKIAGQQYSKNMYRREWRQGGYDTYDKPMSLDDPQQRLIVGLIQKKVTELLGGRQFNNSFQIGMLSSFESFLESISRSKRIKSNASALKGETSEEDEDRVFDGEQEATNDERKGIDTHTLETVIRSYREQFQQSLPHPKLDATADNLLSSFATGEKSLVFVRRVATVAELKSKLDRHYDRWIRQRLQALLPELRDPLEKVFQRYFKEKIGRDVDADESMAIAGQDDPPEASRYDMEEDEGGTDSFFAWFFRGEGPKGLLSGAAFQKNRLGSMSSAYATLFEDDHVSWLLSRPQDPLAELAKRMGITQSNLNDQLSEQAYGYFTERTKQREGYPRYYVFEAYQAAALRFLTQVRGQLGEQAEIILYERYENHNAPPRSAPSGFPRPSDAIGIDTFFTLLEKRLELCQVLWPTEDEGGFQEQFRRREQRRELMGTMIRLGASYIDFFAVAIGLLGSFDLRSEAVLEHPDRELAKRFLDLLERQKNEEGFHAYREISLAAENFNTIHAVNFPDANDVHLSELATLYARTLQHQSPVMGMSGGVNKRVVRQFRMPGYPLVLITTDVLQEGEDLHTFCQRVIHYGITWTPSAMEQRTGRIDRIGSLVQRRLDGRDRPPAPDELIQVHYPHLKDTVERLQVRRVLMRLNKFLRLIHRTVPSERGQETRLNLDQAVLDKDLPVPVLEGVLESNFPVTAAWRSGVLTASDIERPNIVLLEQRFIDLQRVVIDYFEAEQLGLTSPRRLVAKVAILGGKIIPCCQLGQRKEVREQVFELHMRSQIAGDATLIRCISRVGAMDLDDPDMLDDLYMMQVELGVARICARPDARRKCSHISIENDRLFRMETTSPEEIIELVQRSIINADRLEEELLEIDQPYHTWKTPE